MELDAVRALKAEVADTLIRPLVEQNLELNSLAVAAQGLGVMTGVRPGIALGVTRGAGDGDYKLAVRVQQRALERQGRLVESLTEAARGEVDYRYIGRITKRAAPWTQQRQRPLLIGCSVGHFMITAGTLGAFCRKRSGEDRTLMLSNNHVLANEDDCSIGDVILQPGRHDGGIRPGDVVASLLDWVAFQTSGNLVDAAVAMIEPGIEYDLRTLTGDGNLNGVRAAPLQPGDQVLKVGRTTLLTEGVVTAIEVDDVVVRYDRGLLSFDSQIEIEGAGASSFSEGGDSGSVIVDRDGMACALLFAGGDTGGTNGKGLTYANEIGNVLAALDIELAP